MKKAHLLFSHFALSVTYISFSTSCLWKLVSWLYMGWAIESLAGQPHSNNHYTLQKGSASLCQLTVPTTWISTSLELSPLQGDVPPPISESLHIGSAFGGSVLGWKHVLLHRSLVIRLEQDKCCWLSLPGLFSHLGFCSSLLPLVCKEPTNPGEIFHKTWVFPGSAQH